MFGVNGVIALLLFTGANPIRAQTPLSCDMQMLLHGVAAIARDQGKSREEITKALQAGGDVTGSEIRLIIKNVFVNGKNMTPDEIKEGIYANCMRHR